MTQTNTEIVASVYAAYASRDIQAVLAATDPEIEIFQTELLPWGGRHKGYEGQQRFLGLLAQYIDGVPEIDEYLEAGENVVAMGRLRGRVRTTGKPFDIRVVHVWTVRAAKLLRFQAYIDTPVMLQALAE